MFTVEERKVLRESPPFDNRNVADEFKHLTTEEIRQEMIKRSLPFVAICQNLVSDFNISQIVRSMNAFALGTVNICGRRQWDKRGAVGTYHYIDVQQHSDINEVIEYYRSLDYRIVAAETGESAHSLPFYQWNYKTAVVFGEEGLGIIPETLNLVDDIVEIPQYGTVRSFNVAGAAQMMMYDYTIKVRKC